MKTLEKKITLQDIFDAAVTAFLVERRLPCVDGSGNCHYMLDLVTLCPSWFDESVRSLPESRLDDFQYRLHDQLTRRAGLGALSGIRNENEHLEAVRLEYMAVARDYGLTLPANFPVFEEPASN